MITIAHATNNQFICSICKKSYSSEVNVMKCWISHIVSRYELALKIIAATCNRREYIYPYEDEEMFHTCPFMGVNDFLCPDPVCSAVKPSDVAKQLIMKLDEENNFNDPADRYTNNCVPFSSSTNN